MPCTHSTPNAVSLPRCLPSCSPRDRAQSADAHPSSITPRSPGFDDLLPLTQPPDRVHIARRPEPGQEALALARVRAQPVALDKAAQVALDCLERDEGRVQVDQVEIFLREGERARGRVGRVEEPGLGQDRGDGVSARAGQPVEEEGRSAPEVARELLADHPPLHALLHPQPLDVGQHLHPSIPDDPDVPPPLLIKPPPDLPDRAHAQPAKVPTTRRRPGRARMERDGARAGGGEVARVVCGRQRLRRQAVLRVDRERERREGLDWGRASQRDVRA